MDAAANDSTAADQNPTTTPNPNPNPPSAAAAGPDDSAAAATRRPFTSLTQEEADLALARVLQEQERAYMMLSGGHHGGGGEYAASDDGGSYEFDYDDDDGDGLEGEEGSDYDEEDGDGHGEAPLDEDEEVGEADDGGAAAAAAGLDPAQYDDDEAFARALQDAEEREVAGRLMALAGLTGYVDPDEYSYEELVALGEVVGTESRGLPADTLASLPSVTYRAQDKQDGNMEQCVICRVEFEEGESLVALPCKHSYHSDCINQWLQLNKVCPMCSAEVSTSRDNRA
uniref:RING-type domain-containing protein n=1 Tax=Leersia perrieri TaxID=77586 RepID=A0A0D9XAJ5_9ORYZ